MQLRDSRLLLSATDLVNFHECEHLSALGIYAAPEAAKPLRVIAKAAYLACKESKCVECIQRLETHP